MKFVFPLKFVIVLVLVAVTVTATLLVLVPVVTVTDSCDYLMPCVWGKVLKIWSGVSFVG